MKKILLLMSVVVCFFNSFAQINPGFEQWTNYFIYQEPEGYVSTNFAFILTSGTPRPNVFKSNDKFSGSFAAKLESYPQNAGDTVGIPGAMFTGSVNITAQTFKPGFAYSNRSAELRGSYKYAFTNAPDSGLITVILTKYNATLGQSLPVGGGIKLFGPASVYTQFSIPIIYTANDFPDTAIIAVSTTKGFNNLLDTSTLFSAPLGVTMFVDNFAFFGTVPTSGINSFNDIITSSSIFPNPVSGDIFKINYNLKKSSEVELFIYNELGQLVEKKLVEGNAGMQEISINTSDKTNGIYYYQLLTGNNLAKGNFIIYKQ